MGSCNEIEERTLSHLWKKLRQLIEQAPVGAFTFDHGHHDAQAQVAETAPLIVPDLVNGFTRYKSGQGFVPICSVAEAEALVDATKHGWETPTLLPIPLGKRNDGLVCNYCGRDMVYLFNGKRFAAPRCELGENECIVELEVPSGKIVFDRSARELVLPQEEWLRRENQIANETMGTSERYGRCLTRQRFATMYAALGLIDLRTGSAPEIYRHEDNGATRYLIGYKGYTLDNDGRRSDTPTIELPGTKLAQEVCDTNIVQLMDLEALQRVGGRLWRDTHVLEVTPGRYHFRLFYNERSFPGRVIGQPMIQVQFERVS